MAKQAFGRQTALARIGHCSTPPSKRVWAAQCAAYLAAIVFNKVVVASLLYAAKGAMTDVGNWLFGPLQSNPDAELVVVMVSDSILNIGYQAPSETPVLTEIQPVIGT